MKKVTVLINRIRVFPLVTLLLFIPFKIFPQHVPETSADIQLALKKLNVLGSVLYIAAHPDDENTSVLAYLSKGRLMRTAYLSLTRGDGGQNLLGSEQGALLGVIRTQELLAARRLDGADQFFTRAIDFGYSKTADETMRHWKHELVLSDIVKIIRKFRPDIILTRFSRTRGGHGHHLASAILAEEAFHAAADPERFPEQLTTLKPWRAKRIMWNTFLPSANALAVNVGIYNPFLGQSYPEIASAGRSMHKSQGFGATAGRGSQVEYFDHIAGDTARINIFDDIALSWSRIPNGNNIQKLVKRVIREFDAEQPSKIIPDLVEIYRQLNSLHDPFWANIKQQEVKELIRMCSGLWLEAIVWEQGISPGMDIDVRSMVVNRSNIPIHLEKIQITYDSSDTLLNKTLEIYQPVSIRRTIHIPDDAPYSQPYWLLQPNDGDMFTITNSQYIGLAENPPALVAHVHLNINGQSLVYKIPVRYRWTDAVEGEQVRPFIIRPKINLAIDHPAYVFADNNPHKISVHLNTKSANLDGNLSVSLPTGWQVQPETIAFHLNEGGSQAAYHFQVTPGADAINGDMILKADIDGRTYSDQIIEINYSHIRPQTVLQTAKTRLIKLDIHIEPRTIGYIMGSGDDIPAALMQLGYKVDLLSDDDIDTKDLSQYDVIICGVRAFNTRDKLKIQQHRLIDYVGSGGTWIVQHNTRFGTQVQQIGPYPFTASGRDRITEEDAPIQILMPEHPLMNYPNKITERDFDGWVQERGLYFAESWEGKLYPLLAGNDEGEPAKLGGLLYAHYGKGVFMYTAYSWFRQLPAGIPGAYRLFVNLISAKGKQ